MCIIVGEIEEVSRTKIFAGIVNSNNNNNNNNIINSSKGNSQQLIVYSNNIRLANNKPAAMILPFPHSQAYLKGDQQGDDVRVIETNPMDAVFYEMCDDLFPKMLSRSRGERSDYFSATRDDESDYLEVKRCGSYQYSIANSKSDIVRIDPTVFHFDESLKKLLDEYEAQNFGFLVCLLDESAEYAPFAYVSSLMSDGRFFIPTKHYHSINAHQSNNRRFDVFDNQDVSRFKGTRNPLLANIYSDRYEKSASSSNARVMDATIADDWDHTIYVFGTQNNRGNAGLNYYPQQSPSTCSFAHLLGYCPKENIFRLKRKGVHPNEDIMMPSIVCQ